MRRTRINPQRRLPSSDSPLRRHKHTVIQQGILRTTRKQRRGQATLHLPSNPLLVREKGRDRWVASLGFGGVGQERVDERVYDGPVDDERPFKMLGGGEESGEVVAAEVQD